MMASASNFSGAYKIFLALATEIDAHQSGCISGAIAIDLEIRGINLCISGACLFFFYSSTGD